MAMTKTIHAITPFISYDVDTGASCDMMTTNMISTIFGAVLQPNQSTVLPDLPMLSPHKKNQVVCCQPWHLGYLKANN